MALVGVGARGCGVIRCRAGLVGANVSAQESGTRIWNKCIKEAYREIFYKVFNSIFFIIHSRNEIITDF